MHGFRFSQIRDVVAVARRGSLRAAARDLGIAQPAITRSIREVERLLGSSLFERTSKGVSPTPAGEAFVRRAMAIENELLRAREEVAQLAGAETGSVALGMSTVPHLALLPRALPAFRARYPDVQVKLVEGLLARMERQLEDGELDFYVGPLFEERLSSTLVAELLFTNERYIFARRDHPLGGARSLQDLQHASWISTSVTHESGAELRPLFEAHGLPSPHIAMHAQSGLSLVLATAHSDLLTMLPRQWTEFPGIDQLITRVPIQEVLAAPSIYTVRRRRLSLTPVAQYFLDMLCRAAVGMREPPLPG